MVHTASPADRLTVPVADKAAPSPAARPAGGLASSAWLARVPDGLAAAPSPQAAAAQPSPLAGLRFAVKDNIDVAGLPTTAACPAFAYTPTAHAAPVQRLLDAGKTVLIETGGHRSIAQVPAGVVRIMDIKCPGSGESARNDWSNLALLTPTDEVKFVIADRVDYEFARDIVVRESLIGRVAAVLFSPVHGALDAKQLAEWVIADRLEVRVQLQMHKYIWSPETRGV